MEYISSKIKLKQADNYICPMMKVQELYYNLLIDCEDKKGLIYLITQVLFQNNCNIIRNDEYVDRATNHFFMRSELSGIVDADKVIESLKAVLPLDVTILLIPKAKKNIVVLATKEHHCLSELLTRAYFDELNANILAVISNHPFLQDVTEKYHIPFHCISHDNLSREAHEAAVLQQVAYYQPEYLVLAKYMRILTPKFVEGYENRVINIHHSFLPAFIGANPYRQAFERGVKIIGATAHFVNNALDEGPIIAQSVISVDHKMDVTSMSKAGKDVEKMVLSNALKLVFDDKVFINGNKTIVFD